MELVQWMMDSVQLLAYVCLNCAQPPTVITKVAAATTETTTLEIRLAKRIKNVCQKKAKSEKLQRTMSG